MEETKKTPSLTKTFKKGKFSKIESTFRKHFKLGLETTNERGSILKKLSSEDCHPDFCKIIRKSPTGLKRCNAERRRSLKIAIETGQSYISICHAGIVLVCVPVMDKDNALGGMYFGKCLWQPVTKLLMKDVEKRLEGLRLNQGKIVAAMNKLEIISGKRIQQAADFLFDLLYEVGGFDPRVIRWRRYRSQQQAEIGEYIYEKKKLGTDWRYPLESERELKSKVKIGDRTGAREILNSILGTILFHNPGDLGVLKARVIELLSILSRSAVEGGVDVDAMLERNLGYVTKIMQFDTQEDLCACLQFAGF